MISTQNLTELGEISQVKRISQTIAVLDAIICPEWEYRYYSFNAQWSENEACASMRDGSGDEYLILFSPAGTMINGFAHETKLWQVSETDVPVEFQEFIFEEPIKSIGTSFLIWQMVGDKKWQFFSSNAPEDGSAELLFILDGKAETYRNWAMEYYEDEFTERDLAMELVQQVFDFQPLTEAMVLALNPDLADWEQLKTDLMEIDYPFLFN